MTPSQTELGSPPGRHAGCYHCGQPIPPGVDLDVEIGHLRQPMCCRGCQAVAEAIVADLLLLSEHLPQLAEGVALARKTLAIIRQNMAWAIGYNLVALPFAAFGLIAPWMAALGMSASSLLVVANALRLRDKTARATLPRQTPA